jgi:hypothetical protein
MYLCVLKQKTVVTRAVRGRPEIPAIEAVAADPEHGVEGVVAVPGVPAVEAVPAVMGRSVQRCGIETSVERMQAILSNPDVDAEYYKIMIDSDFEPTLSKVSVSGHKPKMVEIPILQDADGNAIE